MKARGKDRNMGDWTFAHAEINTFNPWQPIHDDGPHVYVDEYGEIVIRWHERAKMDGNYRWKLEFSQDDVLLMFKMLFASKPLAEFAAMLRE